MKAFLTIWIGELISIIGSGMTSFALGVWIYNETHQATPFAITVLFGTLPRLLISPLAGSLTDRWNRRWIMILADCGSALTTVSVVILLYFGGLQIWHIYAIALFSSIFAGFQEPAYMASVTMLVPKNDLARVNGLIQVSQSMELLVAPVLAGVLMGIIGLNNIILIDFVTFFFAVGALLIVRIPQPVLSKTDREQKNTVWEDTRKGWLFLTARPGLFWMLWYFALVNFLGNLGAVLLTPLILSTASSAALGVVQTVWGVGMLAGGVLMSVWGGLKKGRIRAVIGFIALSSLGLVISGLHPSPVYPALGFFLMMLCVPLASGHSNAIFQSKISPDMQGRTLAIRGMISRSIMPLAFLLAGPLADQIFEPWMLPGGWLAGSPIAGLIGSGPGRGIGLLFILCGSLLFIISLLVYTYPRIHRIEVELPDLLPDLPG
jgi:MFS family permease